MAMDAILGGKALVNGTDIWTEYGVFLAEKRRGDRNNLKAILSPAKTKTHVAVDIREENGEKYSAALDVKNQARDVKLCFALYADTREKWLAQYKAFITLLKQGDDGWLDIEFPDLDMTLRVFYKGGERLRARSLTSGGKASRRAASTSLFGSRTRRFK